MFLASQHHEERSERTWFLVRVAGAILGLLAISYLLLLKSCFSYYPITDPASTRITSPDSALDAVLVCDGYGGAVGGVDWFVYVLPKGGAALTGPDKAVLDASELDGAKLRWRTSRILEIHYDRAEILHFRSTWPESDHPIEIRLMPSSSP